MVALLGEGNGGRVSRVGDVSAPGVHNGLSSGGQERIRWKEVSGYDSEGPQNNEMRKDYFFGILGVFGNVQLEAHEDEPSSGIHCEALVCGSLVGYVETSIEEGPAPVLQAGNTRVVAAILSDVDAEMMGVVAFHQTETAALGSPRDSAAKHYPVAVVGERLFAGQVAQT